MSKKIKIGILGLGTVGGGTANIIQRNSETLKARTGVELEVIMASVRDLTAQRLCDCTNITLTDDPYSIVSNVDIDIVVEMIGGDTIAKELVLQAIKNKKHVVTANKAMIAIHGHEIFSAAEQNNVSVHYEAAVAGGINIIKDLREGLVANNIELIAGIINGTANFILSEMRDKGRKFDDVLEEAQELGYAEADPTFDIEGVDAAHKLTILASTGFGIPLEFNKIYTEGISKLDLKDVTYAQEMGYQIKHLGIARRSEDGIELRVHPTLIPAKRLIANVDGVMNAVLVKGDSVGNTLHYGAGAGSGPTASAVVADIVDIVRDIKSENVNRVPHLGFEHSSAENAKIKSADEFQCAYYLRIEVNDVAGVMSQLSSVFANLGISIEAITQKEPSKGESAVSVIFISQKTVESNINKAIKEIEAMPDVIDQIVRIRVEHLD